MFHGAGEISKENAFLDMGLELTMVFTRRMDPDTTNKCLEVAKIGLGSIAAFEGSGSFVFSWERIFDVEICMKGVVWPAFYFKVGTIEHGPESIVNHYFHEHAGQVRFGGNCQLWWGVLCSQNV
jgi:hypothetical protein